MTLFCTKYCDLTMVWDHQNGTIEIYLSGYVERALHKFQQSISHRKQYAPHAYYTPKYDATPQLIVPDDTSDPIDATGTKRLQDIVGTILYYG